MIKISSRRIKPLTVLSKIFIWSWISISMMPIVFMITTSLKDTEVARQMPPQWLFTPKFENYLKVLSGGEGFSQGFDSLLLNSIIVTVSSTILCLLVAFPAALALSKPKFRKREFLSSWILSTYMFPPIVAIIPIFIFAGKIQALDTYAVLAIPYAAFNLPIVIWILKSSIEQIPAEIEEAARVDGANGWHYVSKILFPLTIPALATGAILSSILSWNDFLFALALTRSVAKTAPVGIQEFTGMYGTDWGSLSAASVTIIAPVLIISVLVRRRIVSGLTFGAVK
jgi:multiple sugar transport system permease protein/sorbitol/mannitol transport system permease protein